MPRTEPERYYRILGVQSGATTAEIKRAYRKMAVQLHPDRNNSATAHEDFILLTEAYEYMLNDGWPDEVADYEPGWETEAEERARRRAAYYARMNYKDFKASDFYREAETYNRVASNLIFIYAILLAVVLPFFAIKLYGVNGIIPCLVMLLISLPIIIREINRNDLTDPSQFFTALYSFLGNSIFQVAVLSFINVFVFATIGLQTLIPWYWILEGYGLAILSGFILARIGIKGEEYRFQRNFYSFCIAPMAVNLLLLVNFFFSSKETTETYKFKRDHGTTRILLQGNAYEQYPGMRTFIDGDFMANSNLVTYTFKEGLLGYRVMTAYEFNGPVMPD